MEDVMFNTIVWATDGSREADHALVYAKGLAQAENARLVAVHVDEFSVGRRGSQSAFVDEIEVQAAIRRQVEELRREGIRVTLKFIRVAVGRAAQAIAEIAKEERGDLIVTGTRGHGPLSGLLLGSIPHRLTGLATAPVMVVAGPRQGKPGETTGKLASSEAA
jgi:nucleotide-binding universal stress UspA family protein